MWGRGEELMDMGARESSGDIVCGLGRLVVSGNNKRGVRGF